MDRRVVRLLIVALALGAPGKAAAEIEIGFANPLTGPYALTGARNRIAVEMAVGAVNQNGGVLGEKIGLVSADDACGLHESIEAARRLLAAGVRVVVGHLCSHSSLLAAGIYETAGVLMISPSSTHPRLTEEGRQNVFRLAGRDDRQGALAGDFLAARWSGDRIAILHDGSTYGEGLAVEARKQLQMHGVKEAIYDVYRPNEQDYEALAVRLQTEGIAALYIGGYGPDAARILRAIRARGSALQLVSGDALGMDEFWTIAGPAGSGAVFSSRPDRAILPAAVEVLAGFRARGLSPRRGGLSSYAAVQVWAQAVERAGTLELAAVSGILRRGRFDTVLGPVAFDDKGDLRDGAWQWQIWLDGSYRPIGEPSGDAARASPRAPRSARRTRPRSAPDSLLARIDRGRQSLPISNPAELTAWEPWAKRDHAPQSPFTTRSLTPRGRAHRSRGRPRAARVRLRPAGAPGPACPRSARSSPASGATRSPGCGSRPATSPPDRAAARRWSRSRISARSAG
jgi:branched-chain amino acid transport system substrate-binding protein